MLAMCDVGDEGLAGPHGQTIAIVDLMKPSSEVDKELINHLEHVSFSGGLALLLNIIAWSFISCALFLQALALSWDLVKRSEEALLRRRVAELEQANAELEGELGRSNERAKELELLKNTITSGYRKLSQKYKDLEVKAKALEQEKMEIEKSCESQVNKVEVD
jgi:hypothetical protein